MDVWMGIQVDEWIHGNEVDGKTVWSLGEPRGGKKWDSEPWADPYPH